ncbi:UDP-N-acetylmuramate dehydrogenase [Desulfurivibrio alkaliphilus]|uniref:UDP-N-acetylenolpyruvoylglucosamine reductase n=1 Tax=Desulfurivibrio alkaliphilus (strain DSM 19089 / UNIQEM U267 / AHT2) TaxID=589865 RepID=D6Z3P9_DESAT|nr:UDP-N-acetylmuramate dehydrogenase [Desulfurivibrio alkaliphilus]ADH86174.1 UDP-N-acetylenolpyruvoylglucosamine reductase [Desulfurivibrio alkaliphilus AHT 2]
MAPAGCELARKLAGGCLEGADHCPLFSENWPGALSRREPLAPLTTFRVGGPAAIMARPAGLPELAALLAILQRRGCPWRVLGRGSNLLVADRGYAGVVIALGRRLGKVELLPAGPREPLSLLRVEAGCSLASLLNWTAAQGLGGLEFLVGIPGSVGGAAMMNAGAFGQCLSERVVALELVSAAGLSRVEPGERLCFSYRRLQGVAPEEVVGAVILALASREPEDIKKTARHYLARRRAGQPRGVASAGSFFKNPPGDYAGRLIEAAGLKGLRVGQAQVSPRHANFLVNLGGARAAEVLALAEQVQAAVRRQSGVELEPEVHFLGFS